MPNLSKGSKVALKHAANAIAGIRGKQPELGASETINATSNVDEKNRPYASVYLARRRGYDPATQADAQKYLTFADTFGLSTEQAAKVDRVAASTHNISQRGERVSNFLRRVAEDGEYVGVERSATTGAVAASL